MLRSRFCYLFIILSLSASLPVAADSPAAPIVASLRPLALLVDQVTGGQPPAEVLPSARRNAHHPIYRPSDRLLAVRARPLFWLGADLQPSLARLIAALQRPDAVALADGADSTIEHPWLDLGAAVRMGHSIAQSLADRYPGRGGDFRRRAGAFGRRIDALMQEYQGLFAQLPARDYIAEHDAFSPLDKPFRLNLLGALIEADGDRAGARSLLRLQRRIEGRPAVCLVKVARSNLSLEKVIDYRGRVVVVTIDPLALDVRGGSDAFYRFAGGVLDKLYHCMARAAAEAH